ncbi:type VII toxin-antitoxin system HepT family RNase toxin [Caloranaerobacter ferrireducens]|uniref:type VII toxin-antitoxin system HepT family RNase toxin n=1 Tax=Caloranaerobacter ferrireducens TaxID=1323370 RepID=UPI00084D451D|nr:DUF86 domain-containing protein [Caloranaerobacter ferrireducens]
MVNKRVIKERLNQLILSIKKIERYKTLSLDEFLKDEIAQDVVEYNLFIAINMIVDIATHVVTDNNYGYPQSMAESFEILYKENLISQEELEMYRKMVGFRNILAHEYIKINKKIVYNIMRNDLDTFKKFILFIDGNFML